MRVLQAPIDIANQPALSALGLREVGVEARCFAAEHPYRYRVGPDIIPPTRRLPYLRSAGAALRHHNVLHFHYGQSLLRESFHAIDARAARALGKRVVIEFHGSDIRLESVERARNPYYLAPANQHQEQCRERMRRWASITSGHAIQCDHALDAHLAPYFTNIHVVGHRVDTRALSPVFPRATTRTPIVVHSPSNRALKGTQYVRAAVDQLRRDGRTFKYVEIHGTNQAEAMAAYRQADLVIDQLLIGSHGVFAAEAMSLGKPVICYLLPEIADSFPADLPLINAAPDTLVEVLDQWLADGPGRAERGRASRDYAERRHDIRVVARRLLEVYEGLPR